MSSSAVAPLGAPVGYLVAPREAQAMPRTTDPLSKLETDFAGEPASPWAKRLFIGACIFAGAILLALILSLPWLL